MPYLHVHQPRRLQLGQRATHPPGEWPDACEPGWDTMMIVIEELMHQRWLSSLQEADQNTKRFDESCSACQAYKLVTSTVSPEDTVEQHSQVSLRQCAESPYKHL